MPTTMPIIAPATTTRLASNSMMQHDTNHRRLSSLSFPEPNDAILLVCVVLAVLLTLLCLCFGAHQCLRAKDELLKRLYSERGDATNDNDENGNDEHAEQVEMALARQGEAPVPQLPLARTILAAEHLDQTHGGSCNDNQHDQIDNDEDYAASTTVCSICLGALHPGDEVYLAPRCRHLFHYDCMQSWWVHHQQQHTAANCCPNCRASLVVGVA